MLVQSVRVGETHLVEQRDVEREPKSVVQVDFIRQGAAQFLGRHGRVGQNRLGGAVHECDWKHDGLLGLGGLDTRHHEDEVVFPIDRQSVVGTLLSWTFGFLNQTFPAKIKGEPVVSVFVPAAPTRKAAEFSAR